MDGDPVVRLVWLFAVLFQQRRLGGATEKQDTSGDVTSGTLGGLAFTVIEGAITQEEEDGPVAADADGAVLAFDDSIETLAGSTAAVFVSATVHLDDGGAAVGAAFGSVEDVFAESISIRLSREGTALSFWVLNGLITEADVTEPVETDASASDLYISGNFFNSVDGSGVAAFYPGTAGPDFGCGLEVDLAEPGTGPSLGISLASATVSAIAAGEAIPYDVCGEEGG